MILSPEQLATLHAMRETLQAMDAFLASILQHLGQDTTPPEEPSLIDLIRNGGERTPVRPGHRRIA